LRLADFDYPLPPELIAQTPADRRDASRLMVVPARGPIEHRGFAELPSLLPAGALLVVNDARVVPARLFACKPTGGAVELLAVERRGPGEVWACLARGARALHEGTALVLQPPRGRSPSGPPPGATVVGRDRDEVLLRFDAPLLPALESWGEIPLPPYIERHAGPTEGDRERYQTVFARVPGAVAAPTAGLHFTDEILAALAARGIERVAVTLHVGPGTFAPLRIGRDDDLDRHVMHAERYLVPEATAAAHARARAEGRPVIAVGTTVVRTLESALDAAGRVAPGDGETRLFLRPGTPVRSVDRLITNFHLPRSTLLMLVMAFAGRERILAAYAEAISRRYRFFSYGDAMLLERVA
jgi:S-adenosylmethionine:tRNA ribosyltransferase-isomerase